MGKSFILHTIYIFFQHTQHGAPGCFIEFNMNHLFVLFLCHAEICFYVLFFQKIFKDPKTCLKSGVVKDFVHIIKDVNLQLHRVYPTGVI